MKGGTFLYPALLKTLVLPPILTLLLTRFIPTLHPLLLISLYISSCPALFIFRSYLAIWVSTYKARKLGAEDIPRVRGKMLLNFDVLLDWSRSGTDEEVGRMMVVLGRKYGGTYNTRVLGEDSRHVLIDDFDNFVKGKKFYQRAEGFLGDGIFNSDGERSKFHRSLTRPFFHPAHISPDLFIPLMKRFLVDLPTDGPFDIQARFGELSLRTSIMWMCGEDLAHPSADMPDGWSTARDSLGAALVAAQKVVGTRVKIGTIWPLFELGHQPLEEPMHVIRTFFAPIIAKALYRKAAGLGEGYLIDRLVHATDDYKLIEDQLINLLLASRDTITSHMTFLIYAMILHPDTAERIREEVREVAEGVPDVNKDTIRDLKLCRGFVNETLRLFPPVPLKRTLRSSLLPTFVGGRPLYMPGNSSIIIATLLTHRDPKVWGDDAEEFNIDRWANMGKEREAFTAWNIGPRMCMGQPLALALAHTFLVLFCQYLDGLPKGAKMRLNENAQPEGSRIPAAWKDERGDGRCRSGRDKVWIVSDVVLAVKGGLWVSID